LLPYSLACMVLEWSSPSQLTVGLVSAITTHHPIQPPPPPSLKKQTVANTSTKPVVECQVCLERMEIFCMQH
jgi:hypothetical protein